MKYLAIGALFGTVLTGAKLQPVSDHVVTCNRGTVTYQVRYSNATTANYRQTVTSHAVITTDPKTKMHLPSYLTVDTNGFACIVTASRP